MGWITFGMAEIETSQLGEIAFKGDAESVVSAIKRGIDWKTEGSRVLEGAIYGGHLDLAKRILQAGSPIDTSTYSIAYDFCPEILESFPVRVDLLNEIKAKRRWRDFNWALVNEDVNLARQLLSEGVSINDRILISHGMGSLCPIHYAVRKGNLDLVAMVTAAGANPNALDPDGKSPLRLVAENILLSDKQRKKLVCILRSQGAHFVPPVARMSALFAAWFGWRIRE